MKVHVATSRPVGVRCIEYAKANLPKEVEYTDNPEEADVFISVMYDTLLDERFISQRRCYNFHPGILPQYRGSGAFSWAIINQEQSTGITLHELDVDIDHGPIIGCWKFPITRMDTAESLYNRGMTRLAEMFEEFYLQLLSKKYTAYPQDENEAHIYYRKDLAGAMDLTRFIKAFSFEGKPAAYYYTRSGEKREITW